MPRSIEDLYNKLQQNHWYLLPAGTWEKNFPFGVFFIPQNPIKDTFDKIKISIEGGNILTRLFKNGNFVYPQDLDYYNLTYLEFSDINELIEELNRLSKPNVNEEELSEEDRSTVDNLLNRVQVQRQEAQNIFQQIVRHTDDLPK
jgi:hypothetical protein